ncbi:MAG: hypothetical protein M3Z33_10310 [Actinomycetota bacterium]|nr:hypothetical protein [Actinomycetota bacterium]
MPDLVPTWLSNLGALSIRHSYDPVTQLTTYRVCMRGGGQVVCHVPAEVSDDMHRLIADAVWRYHEAERSHDTGSAVPAIDGEVVGFRAWTLYDWKLGVAGRTNAPPWEPGTNAARCHALVQRLGISGQNPRSAARANPPLADVHDAPEENCDCGLYALCAPDRQWIALGSEPWRGIRVCGAVLAWGERFFLHPTGFRAQYAKPILLATSEQWPRPMRAMIAALAQDYACDVISLEYLRDAAREHGRLVPEKLMPEPDGTGSATAELAAHTGHTTWHSR